MMYPDGAGSLLRMETRRRSSMRSRCWFAALAVVIVAIVTAVAAYTSSMRMAAKCSDDECSGAAARLLLRACALLDVPADACTSPAAVAMAVGQGADRQIADARIRAFAQASREACGTQASPGTAESFARELCDKIHVAKERCVANPTFFAEEFVAATQRRARALLEEGRAGTSIEAQLHAKLHDLPQEWCASSADIGDASDRFVLVRYMTFMGQPAERFMIDPVVTARWNVAAVPEKAPLCEGHTFQKSRAATIDVSYRDANGAQTTQTFRSHSAMCIESALEAMDTPATLCSSDAPGARHA